MKIKLLIIFIFLIIGCSQKQEEFLTIATTTSLQNSGLFNYIHPDFEKETGIKLKVIPVGTGAAIEIAKNGDCDLLFIHAPFQEKKFIKDGYGLKRISVMHNSFVFAGPENDPAKISKCKSIKEVLKKIKNSNSVFVSRGDNSGTYTKEMSFWKNANIKPDWKNYFSVGQGMGKTLIIASEKQGYTLSDIATFVKMKNNLNLSICFQNTPQLLNTYSVVTLNPDKFPNRKYVLAKKYIDWLTSKQTLHKIRSYKINNMQLFFLENDNN